MKPYSSFSSLIWTRALDRPHRWWWKDYEVWGVGVSGQGTGGRWYARGGEGWQGAGKGYETEFDARAAAEVHCLESDSEIPSGHVEQLCEHLDGRRIELASFETLLERTSLSEDSLSDAISRGKELARVGIKFVDGQAVYYLEGTMAEEKTINGRVGTYEALLKEVIADEKRIAEAEKRLADSKGALGKKAKVLRSIVAGINELAKLEADVHRGLAEARAAAVGAKAPASRSG